MPLDAPPPAGVPADVWDFFVAEADKARRSRSRYSARTVAEFIRHHRAIERGDDFVLNNNIVPVMARAYMELRKCPGFFEKRERRSAAPEAA